MEKVQKLIDSSVSTSATEPKESFHTSKTYIPPSAFQSREDRESFETAELCYTITTSLRELENLKGTEFVRNFLKQFPLPF